MRLLWTPSSASVDSGFVISSYVDLDCCGHVLVAFVARDLCAELNSRLIGFGSSVMITTRIVGKQAQMMPQEISMIDHMYPSDKNHVKSGLSSVSMERIRRAIAEAVSLARSARSLEEQLKHSPAARNHKKGAHNRPMRKIKLRAIFWPMGKCRFHTMGIGSNQIVKSVEMLTTA